MRAIKSRGGLTHGPGMTESVRLLWVGSMHKCGTICNAVEQLLNLEQHIDNSQHADLGKSRMQRDLADLNKIIYWFKSHNPFTVSDSRLHSLAIGVVASDSHGINCNSVEKIGFQIMQKMDDVAITDVVLKKADQVQTLAQVTSKRKQGDKKLTIDCKILFSRLLIIMQRNTDLEPFFKYELTAEPTALFVSSHLTKSDKSVLAKELKKSLGATSSFQTDNICNRWGVVAAQSEMATECNLLHHCTAVCAICCFAFWNTCNNSF